ncbi:hypothetical protein PX554_18925 [Sphingomonas sp. H39-1-10]|uniref:hypothetical protein n=1 Tax=Sphingomonas pollutisoli TaxID=3030829 RepID=UPI0023B89717|nr:hypothetical protein [Sphingomonas pollutisoli]MDF0490205.1 hypothetical protein [Sphingomonas pollutisoli]
MPKMTERERLAKIETDQQNLAREAETVRRGLRAHYGKLVTELPVERLSEREFRDVIGQAIRVGGSAAISALKGLTAQGVQAEASPGATRKRAVVPPAGGDDPSKVVHP